jgi:Sel1 repeat
MKGLVNSSASLRLVLLLVLAVAPPCWQIACARPPVGASSSSVAAGLHADGLALERRGDESGAFLAFLQAAEDGYPPAQRRLGEIYDSGNSAVTRNYEESIRWYQKAREGGEKIPPPRPRVPLNIGP